MVWFAPRAAATASRAGLVSLTATCAAPRARATSAQSSPTGPAPVTSTRSPGATSALWAAQTPTDSGSIRAAASSLRLSGTGWARIASSTTYWAKAPWIGGVAKNTTSGHRL